MVSQVDTPFWRCESNRLLNRHDRFITKAVEEGAEEEVLVVVVVVVGIYIQHQESEP